MKQCKCGAEFKPRQNESIPFKGKVVKIEQVACDKCEKQISGINKQLSELI